MPDIGEDEPWMKVEASSDGLFYGTGMGIKPDGKRVFYISHAENDTSLERALAAAHEWAELRGIQTVYVQKIPSA